MSELYKRCASCNAIQPYAPDKGKKEYDAETSANSTPNITGESAPLDSKLAKALGLERGIVPAGEMWCCSGCGAGYDLDPVIEFMQEYARQYADELIGEDEPVEEIEGRSLMHNDMAHANSFRNALRDELRERNSNNKEAK